MSHSKAIVLFLAFSFVAFSLFQNCGKMKAISQKSLRSRVKPLPREFMNRSLSLDQKKTELNDNGELEGVVYSRDMDVLYYETTYRAERESTLIRIDNVYGVLTLKVIQSDDYNCLTDPSLPLSQDKQTKLENIIKESLKNLLKKEQGESFRLGCAFPRLVMDSNSLQTNSSDFEIYYSSRECVPVGELFVQSGSENQSADRVILNQEEFFKEQIDLICED